MQSSNSRTVVSVVGTLMMVVTTVLLATWSPGPADTQHQVDRAANEAVIETDR